ncbi:MAG: hypothetical protein HUJ54_01980 [Erysipelotrichaceae bacterium]|nr:hypothetical protein [Erysipelotrichaceae bacterium]
MNSIDKEAGSVKSRHHRLYQIAMILMVLSLIAALLPLFGMNLSACSLASLGCSVLSLILMWVQKDSSLMVFITKVVTTLLILINLIILAMMFWK